MPLDRPIFKATRLQRTWTARDVMDWAAFSGRLQPAWRALWHGIAARDAAVAAGREPGEGALQSLAEEFRYGRDLITVEETEHWLEARAVTMEAFLEHLERSHWRSASEAGGVAAGPYAAAAVELKVLLCVDLMLTGEMDRLAQACSRRAMARVQKHDSPPLAAALARERELFLENQSMTADGVNGWLAALGRDATWFEEQLQQEAAHRQLCTEWLTEANRRAVLQAQRLQLLEIQIERMTFPLLDTAREACLCLRESRQTVAAFAAKWGGHTEDSRFLLGALPQEQQSRLLSLSPGEIVGPEEVEGGFQICRLLSKTEPSLANKTVAATVDEQILLARFADLGAEVIHWQLIEAITA